MKKEQYREAYFLAQKNFNQTLIETIRLLNVTHIPSKILVFACERQSLIVRASSNYIQLIRCKILSEDKLEFKMLANHDSCWTTGVQSFTSELFQDGFEAAQDEFAFTLHTINIIEISKLSSETQQAIRDLSYGTACANGRNRIIEVKYSDNLFPLFSLVTSGMQRVEKDPKN